MSRSPKGLAAMFVALLIPYWLGVQAFWLVCEDAFITFRYSRNLAEGYGPRFNTLPNELPVEGYSNFLWMVLGAFVELVGADITVVMPWLSVMTGVALIATVLHIMDRQLALPRMATFLAALGMVVFTPLSLWSSSGLASVPMTLFMTLTTALLLWGEERRTLIGAGLCAVLLGLTRVEGVYWALTIFGLTAAARLLQGKSVKQRLRIAGTLLVMLYGPYFAWRCWYYQSLFPNTVHVKVAMSAETLARGLQYTLYYVLLMLTPLLLVPASWAAWTSKRRYDLLPFVGLAFGVPLWALVVSGDYMAFFRLMVPGVPFMAVLIGVLWATLLERPRLRLAVPALGLAAALVGTLPGFDIILMPDRVLASIQTRLLRIDNVRKQLKKIGADVAAREGQLFGLPNGAQLTFLRNEVDRWETMRAHSDDRVLVGQTLRRVLGPGARIVTGTIGVIGYYSNLYIYDQNGLVNREVARREEKPEELRWPGHDSFVNKEFFLDERPTVLSIQVVYPPRQALRMREMANAFAEEDQQSFYPQIVPLDRRAKPDEAVYLLLQRMGGEGQTDKGWEAFDRAVEKRLIAERERKRELKKEAAETLPAHMISDQEAFETLGGRWRTTGTAPGEVNLLEQIGYVAGSVDAEDRAVITRYETEQAFDGLNLISSGHAAEASLLEMDSRLVHRWSKPFEEIWPNYPTEQAAENPGFWRRVLLMPDGGLVVVYEGLGLARLDKDSNVLWASPNRAHHDVRMVDGKLYTLTRTSRFLPGLNATRPVFEDAVTVVDPETGKTLRSISVPKAMLDSDFDHWTQAQNQRDPYHTNSIQVLDGTGADRLPALAAGNLLVSMRNIHTIAIIDAQTERVVWSLRGRFALQHDPRILPNGHILVFNNNDAAPSSILELDPTTGKEVWTFEGSADEPFHTPSCGTAERLPNGNTLVVESDPGRAFELAPDGTIVWEFNNPHRAGPNYEYVATLFQVERIPRAQLSWLED